MSSIVALPPGTGGTRSVNEEQLTRLAGSGDASAFDKLVSPYVPRLKDQVRRIIKNEADAEEALQEALINAWRGLPRFRGGSSVYTWLYRITANTAFSVLKHNSRRPRLAAECEEELPDIETPDALLEANQRLAGMSATLSNMRAALRVPFVSCVVDGEQYRTAARRCGIPVGTVRSRVHRARQELGLLSR